MKLILPKRMKMTRMLPRPYSGAKKTTCRYTHQFNPKIVKMLGEVLKTININDENLKIAIVNLAFNRFLANKTPINTSFVQLLRNFDTFNVLSLLCACNYVESAKIVSKGDIRTFIYIFLGFNILSTKYLDDYCVWNSNYTSLWGIDCNQALQIEIFALKRLNYELSVNTKDISKTLAEALKMISV